MKKIILSLILITQGLIAAPIHDAARSCDIAEVARLIENGADVNAVDSNSDFTPLHLAAFLGCENIVKLLINNGADVNAAGVDGLIPLHMVADVGYENIVNILIDHPLCDHTIANKRGETLEQMARSRGNNEIANILNDALSVEQKLFKSKRNDVLQLLAARVVNKKGITKKELKTLPYAAQRLITNIIKDKKPSSLN